MMTDNVIDIKKHKKDPNRPLTSKEQQLKDDFLKTEQGQSFTGIENSFWIDLYQKRKTTDIKTSKNMLDVEKMGTANNIVENYIEKFKLEFDSEGSLCDKKSKDKARHGVSAEFFENELYTIYIETYNLVGAANHLPKFKKNELTDILHNKGELAVNEFRQTILKTIKFAADDLTDLRVFVELIEENPSRYELVLYSLAHWIQICKKKAYGIKGLKYHNFPIVVGKQGTGKSEAVKAITRPVSELLINIDPKNVMDDRYQVSYGRAMVGFLDDLDSQPKAQQGKLKALITAEEVNPRRLYSHSTRAVPMMISFIGTSNKSINEIIYDDEMRRFVEICMKNYKLPGREELDPDFLEIINSINYLAIWQGIDENKPCGYYLDTIREAIHEESVRNSTQDIIEEWAECVEFYPPKPLENYKLISVEDCLQSLREWGEANNQNISYYNSMKFALKIKSILGFEKSIQYKVNRENKKHQKVALSCTLPGQEIDFTTKKPPIKSDNIPTNSTPVTFTPREPMILSDEEIMKRRLGKMKKD